MEVGRASGATDAYRRAIRAIYQELDLQMAAAWEPREPDEEVLIPTAIRHREGEEMYRFVAQTRATELRAGEGLPGRVWRSCEAHWIEDVTLDENFPRRAAAAAAGLHTAVCFPVRSERRVIAALEGFAADVRPRDQEMLETLEVLGIVMGQLSERRQAERVGQSVQRRHTATLQASLDSVITMDHRGRVIEFNPAAERTFGYRTDEAVGREMAELIVPPDLREAHRAGLNRYLETGEARLLDRRIEIEAIRAGGERFPVELTITRIDTPGNPVFTGHVRDITDRVRAEGELRDSRARLVEAADDARRRIERDLHDGAQQQLVAVAMELQTARSALDGGDEEAAALIDIARADLESAITELRELARGIHPAVLTEGGLDPALRGLAKRSPLPVRIAAVPTERFPAPIEAAAYFVVAEALTNAARHATGATAAEVELTWADGSLAVEVRDDGAGGVDPAGGGLRGLADRVTAIGGTLEVKSPSGGPTALRAVMPCGS